MDRLVLTEKWSFEEISKYGADITNCLKMIKERFPEDSTMDEMANVIFKGDVQLWLMLSEDEFKGIVLTDIRTVESTNYRTVRVIGCAGEGGVDLCGNIEEIEKWAWEMGCDAVLPVGREGWKRPLSKVGYEIERVVYRKMNPNRKQTNG